MFIDFDVDIDRTILPEYLQNIMKELDDLYEQDNDGGFGMMLPQIITLTDCAEANHHISGRIGKIIRKRYGLE